MQEKSIEGLRPRQPILAERTAVPLSATRSRRAHRLGSVRIPLAGPYRPRATLYRFPDGRLLWTIRLWEENNVRCRVVGTGVLLEFARVNRLLKLRAELEALVPRATSDEVQS